jgi:hypothetical protein
MSHKHRDLVLGAGVDRQAWVAVGRNIVGAAVGWHVVQHVAGVAEMGNGGFWVGAFQAIGAGFVDLNIATACRISTG